MFYGGGNDKKREKLQNVVSKVSTTKIRKRYGLAGFPARRGIFSHILSPLADPTPENVYMLRLIYPRKMSAYCGNVDNKEFNAPDYIVTSVLCEME